MLLAVCLTMDLLPTAAFAADGNGDTYDDRDVTAIQVIINASPSLKAQYNVDEPGTWEDKELVRWNADSPKRIISLQLGSPDENGEMVFTKDFSGNLDASALTALAVLWCRNNTDLTQLKLPQSESLLELHCYGTGITEPDVSNLPNLSILDCSSTQITSLDVSKNAACYVLRRRIRTN